MFTAFYNFRFQLSLKPNSGKGRGLIKKPYSEYDNRSVGKKIIQFFGDGTFIEENHCLKPAGRSGTQNNWARKHQQTGKPENKQIKQTQRLTHGKLTYSL